MDKKDLIKYFILCFVRNKALSSTYILHRRLTSLGYFGKIEALIEEMSNEGLLTHEGFHYHQTTSGTNVSSGLLKNITISDKGRDLLTNIDWDQLHQGFETHFDNSDIVEKMKKTITESD